MDDIRWFSEKKQQLLFALIWIGLFAGTLFSFHHLDFYHQYFFAHGWIVSFYLLLKIILILYLTWIIYAIGYGLLSLFIPLHWWQSYTLSERILMGFGTGLGCVHLGMLILGYANSYYLSVIVVICMGILGASALHFQTIIKEIRQSAKFFSPKQSIVLFLTAAILGMALIWLLMLRGIYPGGGGDYYTHYFYYYLDVLRHHGLAPNEVWYHYYYSKGAGLHFLGMLLMDPEAPALMTFCCAAMAAFALANLVYQVAPRSFWPACCALLYILYNLIALNGADGGEFQKTHEETTAMIVLAIWAVCLMAKEEQMEKKSAWIMLCFLIPAVVFITQALGVYFAIFFTLLSGMSYFQKKNTTSLLYLSLGLIAAISVGIAFGWNYLSTGLITDQALNVAWKFANLGKLNEWGVLPNIMLVAWIRDNYDMVAVPWTLKTIIKQLINFMRLDVLKALIIFTGWGFVLFLLAKNKNEKINKTNAIFLFIVFVFISVLAAVSIFAGHSQAVSYFRFSSFFFPLVVLLCVLMWTPWCEKWEWLRYECPIALLVLVLLCWPHWGRAVKQMTAFATHYSIGQYSLADAYAHQIAGISFGGIHPGTYAAIQHIAKGARVWSTNVSSYCMAPDCKIESVVSFKLSSNLNTILNGTPEQAKKILQAEGLNYFLISTEFEMIDILPFSRLFHPAYLTKYFSIKWTDGKTYLLTWRKKDDKLITQSFVRKYALMLQHANHPWFRFKEAVPAMDKTLKQWALLIKENSGEVRG